MTNSIKTVADIRQAFIQYFEAKGHKAVDSSSLVPQNDPTLLFTNAGMNQFKDLFLGAQTRDYTRAVTAQRCVRAGGKHNDLENVGYTARHHTFFEMLGNFSFGDYFKRDAIHYAWELLTSETWFNLPKDKLLVTIYHNDDEAFEIWHNEIGVPSEKIIRIGDNKGALYASDNFWQMGDTGPCGPCSEIFYDHGDHIWGGPPGSPEEDGDRFIEIWNLVFMQFNRLPDGTMENLPKPSIDTGMGLERLSAVIQHVNSNYDIDLFQTLIKTIGQLLNVSDLNNKSLRVIADHIRSTAFLIADGVLPSNEGRGYVLRRIIRRAVRHGNLLGAKEAFFYKLVNPLIDVMHSAGTEIARQQTLIETTLKAEEEQFARTLERGLMLLDEALSQLKGDVLSGEIVFKLYDTFGFPIDLTADVCREKNITIDEAGFEREMENQRKRAREASGFNTQYAAQISPDQKSEFDGYFNLSTTAKIEAIYVDGKPVETLNANQEAILILDKTTFYAESGGQVGDVGQIKSANNLFSVRDTQKYTDAIGHVGNLTQGSLKIGDLVETHIDEERRAAIRINHSATHLLHSALRHTLGEHVAQKGSLVNEHYLRFDFSHTESITQDQLIEIENSVNDEIRKNHLIDTTLMDIDSAKAKGAMALFGEKYSDEVRVLSMGDYSIELCGGTHASRTGDIGLFKILSESGIAAGIRRIEATTGKNALLRSQADELQLIQLASMLKSDKLSLVDKITQQLEKTKLLEKEIAQLKAAQLSQNKQALIEQAKEVKGVKLLTHKIESNDIKLIRNLIDDIKNQMGSGIVLIASLDKEAGKATLLAGVTKDLVSTYSAGALVAYLAPIIDGKGGGKPDFAQAGGTNLEKIEQALNSAESWINSL
ncbi:alanine--tRNA ligase [Thorsellia anophelis]|uniref:Alanine--tRNA ligase n=1 Tax=Thorsellia anophelis DSM 18579 TaxID=1123402 RepID=A0A1H9YPD7_9GAMM|nr:alanine--tRNA ligase [Thorsellia anophelis]SES71003.1 alanyl-tRNA synthetase [Thorsellia anophelis DSM 18579]